MFMFGKRKSCAIGNVHADYSQTCPQENSINVGNPQDHTDHNIIRYNTFGPGVQAENIDVKEFTTYGMIQHNLFNGYGMCK